MRPVRSLEAAVKPVRIRDLDIFGIDMPVPGADSIAGVNHRYRVVKVMTAAGVRGPSPFDVPTTRIFPPSRR